VSVKPLRKFSARTRGRARVSVSCRPGTYTLGARRVSWVDQPVQRLAATVQLRRVSYGKDKVCPLAAGALN